MIFRGNHTRIRSLILSLACFCFPTYALAETVLVLASGNQSEELLVEGAMKRHLRAEGYTVKGGTTDGYLLLIAVIPNLSIGGRKYGVTGHLTVSSLSWQEAGDSFVTERCKGEHDMAQTFKGIIGTQMVYIDSYIDTAANEEALAEMMSTYANRQIRATSKKVTELFQEMGKKYNTEVSSPPVEQIR